MQESQSSPNQQFLFDIKAVKSLYHKITWHFKLVQFNFLTF